MKKLMGMIRVVPVLLISIFILNVTSAQRDLSLTFRNGFNFPTRDLGTTNLNKGGGFETTIGYQFIPQWSTFIGWGRNSFKEKSTQTDSRRQFEETGYRLGIQYNRPFSKASKVKFILGAGGLYNHIEVENKNGDIIEDTGHGWGWQTDAGVALPLGHRNRWHIIPSIRYQSLHRNLNVNGLAQPAELNYVSFGVGVSWTIWSGFRS